MRLVWCRFIANFSNRLGIYFILFLMTLVVFLGLWGAENSLPNTRAPVAINGVIDLTDWDVHSNNDINLDGYWRFYWNQLLTPKEIMAFDKNHSGEFFKRDEITPVYTKVPGFWDKDSTVKDVYSNEGHGTYSLLIKGLSPKDYGLIIPTTYTANKIWINEKVVAQSGVVGTNAIETDARWRAHDVFFASNGEPVLITIQMSTYDHPHFDGGITRAITLGEAKHIHYLSVKRSLFDWLVVGIFLILAFYQLVVYWFKKQDLVPLYFTLVSFLIAFGALLTRNSFLHESLFDFDFSITQRLIYVCQSFIAVLFLKYTEGSFPKYFNKKVVNVFVIVSVLYFLVMMILTPNEPYIARQVFSYVMALTIGYGFFCVGIANHYNEKSAGVFFIGMFFVALCFVYEILIANDILLPTHSNKDGPASIGLIIFVISQTYILARRHSDTVAEKLLHELAHNEKNRFLAAASHDLRQPLYSLQLMGEVLSNQEKKGAVSNIVSGIHQNTRQMEELLNNILDFAKADQVGIQVKMQSISMTHLFRQLQLEYQIKAEEKGLRFRIVDSNMVGCSDWQLLTRILGNFLSNAIRYTQRGGILLGCRKTKGFVRICVYDTGPGIQDDRQEAIFNEFYQLNKDSNISEKGLGLGLSIVKRFATALGHSIKVQSTVRGTVFSIEIPRINC